MSYRESNYECMPLEILLRKWVEFGESKGVELSWYLAYSTMLEGDLDARPDGSHGSQDMNFPSVAMIQDDHRRSDTLGLGDHLEYDRRNRVGGECRRRSTSR